MQTCQGSFRLHLAFIVWKSMAGMCATIHYIMVADECILYKLPIFIWTLGLFLETIGLLVHIYLRIYLSFTRKGKFNYITLF